MPDEKEFQREQKANFYFSKGTNLALYLSIPAFMIGSIFSYLTVTYESDYVVREMPVIGIYCNELDIPKEKRLKALKNTDNPIARCYEQTVWNGKDAQWVRGLAAQKGEDILNSLFAITEGQKIARAEATNILRYFPKGSDAEQNYMYQAEESIKAAATQKSSYKLTSSYVRPVNRNGRDFWVVKYQGTWLNQTDKTKGKLFTLYIVFSSVYGENRNKSEQAIQVMELEVNIDN